MKEMDQSRTKTNIQMNHVPYHPTKTIPSAVSCQSRSRRCGRRLYVDIGKWSRKHFTVNVCACGICALEIVNLFVLTYTI